MQPNAKASCAYFVMAHHRPEQLALLIAALSAGDPGAPILLHVDLKSLLGIKRERNGMWGAARELAAAYPNVRLMRPRFTNWGGWTLSSIHLRAIDLALRQSGSWTHFVNLSGQCYPIKPMDQILGTLARDPEALRVQMRPFETLAEDDWHLRRYRMTETPVKAIKRPGPWPDPEGFRLAHTGSQWSILPRAFCEWQQRAPIAQRIRRFLSKVLLSDELIIQTLADNSPWRDRIAPHYGREIVWPGPKVMTMADVPGLLTSPAFFARKFDPLVDPEVVPALAERLGYAPAHVLAAE